MPILRRARLGDPHQQIEPAGSDVFMALHQLRPRMVRRSTGTTGESAGLSRAEHESAAPDTVSEVSARRH